MKKRIFQILIGICMMLSILYGSALAIQREVLEALSMYYLTEDEIYTITFTPNGGRGETVCQSFLPGEEKALIPNSFTKMGYAFAGWNTLPNGGGIAYADKQPVTIQETITLYAQWVPATETTDTISVAFSANDGTGATRTQIFNSGIQQRLLSNTFVRSGYTFIGWNTRSDGSGRVYTDGQFVTMTSSLTLYAQWQKIEEADPTIIVTFSANHGTGVTVTQAFVRGQGQALRRNTFVRNGYQFVGWNTSPDGSGSTYADGQSVTLIRAMTLYAQWEPIEQQPADVSITFSSNDGTGAITTQSFVSGETQALLWNPFVRSGYTFQGWNSRSDGTGTAYKNGQRVTISESMLLYAQWGPNTTPSNPTVFVTFVANDGSGTMLTQSFVVGKSQALLPNSFVRNGYTFTGWNTSPSGSGSYYADEEIVTLTGSLTLYARWERNTTDDSLSCITVTAGEGGSITPSGRIYRARGEHITFTISPRTGYEVGAVWVDGRSVGAASSYRLYTSQSNHTITVQFQKKEVEAVTCFRDWRCPLSTYTDCDINAWYHDGVHYCLEEGFMVGVSAQSFAPNRTVTRGQFITILYQLAGRPSHSGQVLFSDVKSGDWFYNAVVWAGEQGLVTGSGIGMFFPNDALTREELAVLLYRYAGSPVTTTGGTLPFSDEASVSSHARAAMRWAYENEILTGMGNGTIAPQGTATRAQIACVIRTFLALTK